LTFRGRRAILPALMRLAALALLALLAVPLAGCGNACQDLGNRICSCSGGGTSADTCKQQVTNLLKDTGVGADAEAFCSQKLDTCNAPSQPTEVRFCEWVNTGCGKASCGLSFEDPADPLVCAPAAP
jgi:hypothetical protein